MANDAVERDALVGQTLGHYRITGKIGAGGMGEVYRARDERLDRDVAIKLLPIDALSDEAARKHFRKEALALSKLNHPNIESIFDFDSDSGRDFIVTEYIPGEDLDQQLASGALAEGDIARLGGQLADGLAAAHEQGIIHRDLKPSNLRITPDGRLKILDFGVAKLATPVSPDAATASLSESMRFAGTLPYMAPEQVRGEKVDARTDAWAAGAVLYTMATGRRPFRASGLQVTHQILHDAPPPVAVSPVLEAVILKCLDKDPGQRYQSARELAVDLRRFQAELAGPHRPASPARRRYLKPVSLGLGTMAVIVTLLIAGNVGGWRQRLLGQADASRIQSLAVLPLVSLSPDPQQEYFADGMTDELIATLGKIGALRVISRTSVMPYKETKKTLPTIGRELNVDAVVEGSVLRSGNQIRITTQLVQVKNERQLWAESYERKLTDILLLQSDVARAIAAGIRIELAPQEQRRLSSTRSVNPEAYDAYLQGRFYGNQRSQEGVQRCLEYFQKAVALDPSYALAYAGMADSYIVLMANHWLAPGEAIPPGRTAALKALSLDDSLAEAHTSMASITELDWEWAAAEKEYQRALQLNPSYATAHLWYAVFLSEMGRHDEAVAQARSALDIDPLSLISQTVLGQTLYNAHRYDEAQHSLAGVLKLDPHFWPALYCAGVTHALGGRFDEAVADLNQAANLSPADDMALSALAYAYGRAGKKEKARTVLEQLNKLSRQRYVSGYLFAVSYAGLGQNTKALQSLERAYQERDTLMTWIGAEPMLDSLRSDQRFQNLLNRMNLSQAVPSP